MSVFKNRQILMPQILNALQYKVLKSHQSPQKDG